MRAIGGRSSSRPWATSGWSITPSRAARTCGRVVLVVPASSRGSRQWRTGGPVSGAVPRRRRGGSKEGAHPGRFPVPGPASPMCRRRRAWSVVHDAARPLAPAALFDAVVAAVRAARRGRCPVGGVPTRSSASRAEPGGGDPRSQRRGGRCRRLRPSTPGSSRRAHEAAATPTDDPPPWTRPPVGPGGRGARRPVHVKVTHPRPNLEIAEAILSRRVAEWATGR